MFKAAMCVHDVPVLGLLFYLVSNGRDILDHCKKNDLSFWLHSCFIEYV